LRKHPESAGLEPWNRTRNRIAVIEAMRGVAALAVALYHFSRPMHTEPARWLGGYGWLGVDAFFIISGVVVPLSLVGRRYDVGQFPAFMARRLVRLEPAYLASIVLSVVLWHLSALAPGFQGGSAGYSLGQLAAHVLYVIPLTKYTWLSPVYWSLAFEFVFYCLVGLLFPTLMQRRPEWTVAIAALATCCFVLAKGQVDLYVYPIEFLIGILVMRLIAGLGDRAPIVVWLLVGVASVFAIGGIVRGSIVSIVALVILRWHGLRLGRGAYLAGAVSYSLYLTHVPIGGRIVNLLKRFGDGPAFEVAVMVVAALASIAFAAGFAYAIERPSIKASRQFFASSASA
jgi:peptidoglycan/LPS O-acetylase OafA/YrhL